MTQDQAQIWCDRLQAKLMAALDAAWETIANSDDPAAIKQAREKAKACGEFAAQARKIAAMSPRPKAARPPGALSGLQPPVDAQPPRERAINRLKGGSRGRL